MQVDDVPLDDVPNVIDKYHICVVKNRRIDSNDIARATQMKLIMQFGVGLEGFPLFFILLAFANVKCFPSLCYSNTVDL